MVERFFWFACLFLMMKDPCQWPRLITCQFSNFVKCGEKPGLILLLQWEGLCLVLLNGEVTCIWQAQEEIGRMAQDKLNFVATGFTSFCLMAL